MNERDYEGSRSQGAPPGEVPQYAYGWLLYVVAGLAAVLLAYGVFKLHYGLGQAPHRIVKIFVGLALLVIVFAKPQVSLYAWLLAIPLAGWLPVTGIPGLNAVNLLFALLLMAWILPAMSRRERLMGPTPLRWPVAAYLGILLASVARSAFFSPEGPQHGPYELFFAMWQRVPAIAVYYVAANSVRDEKEIRNLLVCLAVGASMLAIVSLQQFGRVGPSRRVGGGMNSNDLGAYFAMCGTMLVAQVIASPAYRGLKRFLIWVGSALATVGVLIPKSRGAYVGYATSLGVLTYITNKKLFVLFVFLLALSPIWAPSFVRERLAETRQESVEAAITGDVTDRLDPAAAVRLEIWAIILREFPKSPIIGHGFGSVPRMTEGRLAKPFSAHSLYFETLADIGLVGLGVVVWLFAACLRSGRRLRRLATDPLSKGLATGFVAATVALLVANVFGQRFSHRAIIGTYFFVAGLVDRAVMIREQAAIEGDLKGELVT